jgi:hypothetical protein
MTVILILLVIVCGVLLWWSNRLHATVKRLVIEASERDELAQMTFGPMLKRFPDSASLEEFIEQLKVSRATLQADFDKIRDEVTRVELEYIAKHDQLRETFRVSEIEALAEDRRKRAQLEKDFKAEVVRARMDSDYQAAAAEHGQKKAALEQEYQAAMVTYNALKAEVSSLEENLEDMSFGLYTPHFTFQTSEEYKAELDGLRDKQRELIKNDLAAFCPHAWVIGNSRAEGVRMVKLYKKVLLRAFNGECDAAISNVTWNNVDKMQARVTKSFESVNDCGRVTNISLTAPYLEARLAEVRMVHEYEAKRWEEKESLRAMREEKREELKAAEEIEEAQEEAEKQENTYEKLLAQARAEAAEATGAQLRELIEKVATFEAKLDDARKKKEKAISRAQLTKSGFVYIISNIGAFGENVFKIGMTRRMEPMERISELSGASVPFPFDLHAMLYSDNAPALESALHQHFDERKLNLVNPRKEFYQHVRLSEIKEFVTERGLSAQFIDTAEARQYRETIAMREEQSKPVQAAPAETFGEVLFA